MDRQPDSPGWMRSRGLDLVTLLRFLRRAGRPGNGAGETPVAVTPRLPSPTGSPRWGERLRAFRPPSGRRLLRLTGAVAFVGLALFLLALHDAGDVVEPFLSYRPEMPSRLYASPTVLAIGDAVHSSGFETVLASLGYREAEDEAGPLDVGLWSRHGDTLRFVRRSFPDPRTGAVQPAARIRLVTAADTVRALWIEGAPAERLTTEAPLLASYYDDVLRDTWPVRLEELPPHVVNAFLAAEDDDFYQHPGVSLDGIARAAWKNLTSGRIRQGGSTITQQLVKNRFLDPERTFARKAREAILAVALELRYSKDQILEAYLNEIYLGNDGPVNLVGLGAASRAFYGKAPEHLTVTEAATLAGMVSRPGAYDPRRHEERSRARRDWVLSRMARCGLLDREIAAVARAEPLRIRPYRIATRRAPYFDDYVAREAAGRYGIGDLRGGGYTLFSSLDWRDQLAAREAIETGLEQVTRRWERGRASAERPLQGALVSLDPSNGAIRAYVGGLDYRGSQWDRARQSRRQAGSVFKPIVYAAALADDVVRPYDYVEDRPLRIRYGVDVWKPRNYDREYRGRVTVRRALEHSLNLPAVRVALATGLRRIEWLAEALGVDASLEPRPSLALGAFDLSPLSLSAVYAAFANGGYAVDPTGLVSVFDRRGRALEAQYAPARRRVMHEEVAYQMTDLLRGVVRRGTGASARAHGLEDVLAGKTGTSNDRRDSWFAGYAPERATVVWVGYDDNGKTRLTGSRGALPVWARFMASVRPAGGYTEPAKPASLVERWVDPSTGQLASTHCPHSSQELLYEHEAEEMMEVCWHASLPAWIPMGPQLDPAGGHWKDMYEPEAMFASRRAHRLELPAYEPPRSPTEIDGSEYAGSPEAYGIHRPRMRAQPVNPASYLDPAPAEGSVSASDAGAGTD